MTDATDVKVLLHDVDHLAHEVDDHEERIRLLEKARWQMAGLVGLVSGIASATGAAIGVLFK